MPNAATGTTISSNGDGTSSFASLNLAGGSNYVTGVLPAANLPSATTGALGLIQLTGDLGGTSSSPTVISIRGTTIPSSPGANQVLVATGASTSVWSQIYDGYVASSAAVQVSKLASGTSAQILLNNATPTPTWTTITGDVVVTGAGSTTVNSLQGNAISLSTLSSLQDGYVLSWNNSAGQIQAVPTASTVVDGQDYQFSNTSSDVAGYFQLFDNATGSEADLSVAVTSGGGKTLIKSFASVAASPQVDLIPAGLWEFNLYAYASLTGAFTTKLIADVYTRTAGVEALLFTANSGNIQVTSVTLQNFTFNYQQDTYISSTTRIVIKISAQTTNIVSTTAHFVFDGTTHASIVRTPIAGSALQLGGDLSGTTSAATVNSISGSSPIAITPATLQWISGTSSPSLTQASISSGSGTSLTLQAQGATGASNNGGNLILSGGTSGSATAGQVQIPSQALFQNIILNDGYNGALTNDGYAHTIYTEPAQAASTTYDYIVTVVGQNVSNGDMYRADLAFTYQRIGSATPTAAGGAPIALNVRTSGSGNTYGGPSVTTSGNSVAIQVTGVSGTNVSWSLSFNRVKAS